MGYGPNKGQANHSRFEHSLGAGHLAKRIAAELVRDFLGRPSGFEAYRAWLEAG